MTRTGADVHELGEGTPPVIGEVERIAAHTDPVVRNLRITHCYHLLSQALAARTGGAANWCTFAVWASKQVGQTIRREDLARTVTRLLKSSPEVTAGIGLLVRGLRRGVPREVLDRAHGVVREAVVATARLDDVSAAAARGNLKVFEEVAREFARFLAEFPGGAASGADERRIREFCAPVSRRRGSATSGRPSPATTGR
ncbi:hypothetical protein SAMN05216188_106332 [Lentzea xinjiangensis]|uniref:Uncharacterized protein n=1 Tax=Lentzea xinjiangensis TaxID=402600 RepID=A0A1H9K7L6_9PSEU|nr:hypothetical protein [Lentzea xinjiangensis]SEQ95062.1 hypothetical protein SAMN05216188_106332 [Lentzea xinjiangensis]